MKKINKKMQKHFKIQGKKDCQFLKYKSLNRTVFYGY